jgi:hypothetical protein
VFGIFSLQETNPTWRGIPHFFIYLAIIILGGFFTILSIYYHIKLREVITINKKDIIEEMNLIEARFEDQRRLPSMPANFGNIADLAKAASSAGMILAETTPKKNTEKSKEK